MRGRETAKPVEIPGVAAIAEPVRFLDYLLEDIQPAVLLFKHGILIHVPAPARCAFHKLVVSQGRRAGQAEKIRRDLSQAEQLFEMLVEGRPGDLILAHEAAEKIGGKFVEQLSAGMAMIDAEVSESVKQMTG